MREREREREREARVEKNLDIEPSASNQGQRSNFRLSKKLKRLLAKKMMTKPLLLLLEIQKKDLQEFALILISLCKQYLKVLKALYIFNITELPLKA